MSGRVSEQTLEEIRQRTDIVDLIGSRLPLKRAGGDFKACCPFHREKTPSFIVSPSRRTFHCFGCGAHGDVFKYLMMADGMTFMDAVKSLAERAGVTLDMSEDYESVARGIILRLLAELSEFYQRCLEQIKEAECARDYLASRKLDDATVKRFGIGYAPDSQGTAIKWAKKHGYTAEQLVTAGVLTPPKEGRAADDYYDRFHGRLMFPIRNVTGQVIGFSGRILGDDRKIAKYVNSPETPVFHKGNVLYALDFARQNIVKNPRREALVCEGQIDVIRCHSAGFGNAVASQGTAFTEDHVKLLKRYADSALLVFDGDGAGLKAAVRTGRLFLQEGIPVQVATLPEGEDPDSLIKNNGPDAFQAILDNPESLISFQIRTLRKIETSPDAIDARTRITAQVLETLSSCRQAVMRSYLENEAASLLGVPVDALQADIAAIDAKAAEAEKWKKQDYAPNAAPKQNQRRQQPDTPVPRSFHHMAPVASSIPADSALTSLAELLIHSPDNAEVNQCVFEWLPPEVMGAAPEAQIISAAIADAQNGTAEIAELCEHGDAAVKDILTRLSTRESKALFAHEMTPLDAAQDLVARAWIDYMKHLRNTLDLSKPDELKRRFELSAAIKRMEANRDWPTRADALYPEYERICRARQEISDETTAQ